MRNYQINYEFYNFIAEEKRGDYFKGKKRLGYTDRNGYVCHSYKCKDNFFRTIYEHIAKWEYFNGKIPKGMEIDHIIPVKDGGTNKLSNLRLVTHKENMNNPKTLSKIRESSKNSLRNLTISLKMKGRKQTIEHRINAANAKKKKIYQYTKDLQLLKVWNCVEDVVVGGFCRRNVGRCCRGERKTHKGYKWSYVPL